MPKHRIIKSRTKKRKQKGGVYYDTLPKFIKTSEYSNLDPFENDDLRKSAYYDTTVSYYKKRERGNSTIRNIISREESNESNTSERKKTVRLKEIEENPNIEITNTELRNLELPMMGWKLVRTSGPLWDSRRYYRKIKAEDTLEGKYNKLTNEKNYHFYLSRAEVDELRRTNTLKYRVVEFRIEKGRREYTYYYRLHIKADADLDELKKNLGDVQQKINNIYGRKFSGMNGHNIDTLESRDNRDPEKKEYLQKTQEITDAGLFAEKYRIAAEISQKETYIGTFISKLKSIMDY